MAEATRPLRAQDPAGAGRQGGPHPLDHGRPGLRRRLGLDHRRHPAEHRGRRPGGHPRASQGPPAQPGARLRGRRRVHEVLVPGRRGPARHPFVLVVEGSIPNEKIKSEGYWAALGTDKKTGQPITTCEWIDRLAPKALAVVAAGTCATYGGIHAMAGNPTGCMGLADYLGWNWQVEGRPADRQRARLPGAAGQLHGDAAVPALPGGRPGPDDPARRAAAADLALRQDRPRGLRPRRLLRAGRLRPRVRLAQVPGASSAAGGRWSTATSPSAAGWPASAAAPTSAASASAAPCPASPTSSCRSWTSRPAAIMSSALRRHVRPGHPRPRGRSPTTRSNKEPKWRHRGHELTTGYHPTTYNGSRLTEEEHTMATVDHTAAQDPRPRPRKLVEMSWDPITRIVGSLGIYTKIDFANRQVAECHSTSSIFRGYSIFMKGKDPRDAHFITSRICGICGDNHATCAVLRPEHGLRHPAARPGRVDRQPRRGRRVHVRPQHLPGQPGRRRLLRADGQGDQPGVWDKAQQHRRRRTPASTATAPSPTSCGRSTRSPASSTARRCR